MSESHKLSVKIGNKCIDIIVVVVRPSLARNNYKAGRVALTLTVYSVHHLVAPRMIKPQFRFVLAPLCSPKRPLGHCRRSLSVSLSQRTLYSLVLALQSPSLDDPVPDTLPPV